MDRSDHNLTKAAAAACTIVLLIGINCSKELAVRRDKKITIPENILKDYRSRNWERRLNAVITISKYTNLKDPLKAEILLYKATYDDHTAVRIEAIKGLSEYSSKIVIDRIKKIAKKGKNANEKWYALNALARYGDPDFAEIFLSGLKSKDWLIREISIKGILMIDSIKIKYKLIPVIIKAINDPNESVRIAALNNLDIKDKAIYKELIKKIKKKNYSKNTFLRAVLKALSGYKLDKSTRSKIINLLTHRNPAIRILALRVLKEEKVTIELR